MLHAASAAGSVYLALVAPGMVEPMVLANQAGYGLITGYAAVPAGQYEAVVSANGREWRQPVEFLGGEPMSLLLTDGPDGPVLRTLRDVPEAPAALNPPTLTMPASGSAVEKTTAKTPAIERSDGRRIAVVLCAAAIMGAAVLMARARPTRRPGQQNDAVTARGCAGARRGVRWFAAHDRLTTLRDYLGGPLSLRFRRGGRDSRTMLHCTRLCGRAARREVVRRARPVDNTARLDLDVDDTARLPRGAVKPSVPPRRPRQQNDAALHEAVRRAPAVRWFAAHDRLTTLRD